MELWVCRAMLSFLCITLSLFSVYPRRLALQGLSPGDWPGAWVQRFHLLLRAKLWDKM